MSQKNYLSNYSTAHTNPKSKGVDSQYNSNNSTKDDIAELKRKAQEAHLKMQKRKRAVVKIQKIARGYIARCKFEKLKRKLRLEYEERIRMQKLKQYFIQKAPEIICNAIYTYICKKRYKEKLMLRKYINHCAVMIQANIRGVLTRKKYKVAIQHRRLFIDLLDDIVKGWKTRKCFKHRACKRIIMEIRELEHFEKEDDEEGGEKFRKSIATKLRSKKIELQKVFRVIYNQGVWMYKYTPDVSPTSKGEDFYRSRGIEESYNDEHNESASQVSRNLNDDYDTRPIRGRGSASRYDDTRMSRNSIPNAWEERENRPIGGIGSKSRNWNDEQDVVPASRGSRKPTVAEASNDRDSFISRGKRRAPSNAFEERENVPIGGNRGGPSPYDERDNLPVGKRGALNPYEERENMPIGVKKAGSRANFDEDSSPGLRNKKKGNDPDDRPIKPAKNALEEYPPQNENEPEVEAPVENEEEEEDHDEGAKKKGGKGAFLKRKQKYDPRKAIEEAKKTNSEVASASIYKNKKSEQLRNAIKAARGVPEDDKNVETSSQPETKPKKKVSVNIPDDQSEDPKQNAQDERPQTGEQKERKFNFLKRKSKAMEQQKVDWKTTPSRIDCWGKKDAEVSRSPERAKSKGRAAVPKIAKITKVQEHDSQKNSPRPKTAPKEEPKRTQMKSPDIKRPGTQAGRKESPPKKKTTKTQPSLNANHQIKLEDLEKAYTANFLGKYNIEDLTEKFYSENGARDITYEYNSMVPIIRQDSLFFKHYDPKNYHNALVELDQEYQSLQTIS